MHQEGKATQQQICEAFESQKQRFMTLERRLNISTRRKAAHEGLWKMQPAACV